MTEITDDKWMDMEPTLDDPRPRQINADTGEVRYVDANLIDGDFADVATHGDPHAMPVPIPPHQVANPLDVDPEAFQVALDRRKGNRQALMAWVRDSLAEGTDFGSIEVKKRGGGTVTSKPILFKPGAEKICGMLGLRAEFPDVQRYIRQAQDGATIATVVLKCFLVDSQGVAQGEGTGARLISQDDGNLNKTFKMCQKSAQIDAVLRCAGLSEIFTQDLADDPPPAAEDDPAANEPLGQGVDADYLLAKCADLLPGHDPGQVLESLALRRFRISDGDWRQIPRNQLRAAITCLKQKAEANWT